MDIAKILLTGTQYFILNKRLVKEFGLECILVLSTLIQLDENQKFKTIKKNYKLNILKDISSDTTLSLKTIKESINKLYKLKFIDVIMPQKKEEIYVKILYINISNYLIENHTKKQEKQIKQTPKGIISNRKKFKKPLIKELENYFHELGDHENSTFFYDYYESNGWKVGRNPMKCWQSAARNWLKRANNNIISFPNYYDKKIEQKLKDNPKKLLEYHKHLKKIGWENSYSPTAGTKGQKKKLS